MSLPSTLPPAPTSHHPHATSTHSARPAASPRPVSLDRLAVLATLHCLSGCAVGEIAGLALGKWLGLGTAPTIALAVLLAFTTGYLATLLPLRRHGLPWRSALRTALAADTASIATMELVDNLLMLVIPGAMSAPLDSADFWGSLLLALVGGGLAAFPVNRYLIARGRGHALGHCGHS